MPDRVISVPQATQIATKIKNKFDTVNGRLGDLNGAFDYKKDAQWGGATYNDNVALIAGSSWVVNTGTPTTTTTTANRARSNVINNTRDIFSIQSVSGYEFYVYGNNLGQGNAITRIAGWTTSVKIDNTYKYLFVVLRKTDNADITSDDLSSVLNITKYSEILDYATEETANGINNKIAQNVVNVEDGVKNTVSGITIEALNGVVTCTGNATANVNVLLTRWQESESRELTLSSGITGETNTNYFLYIAENSNNVTNVYDSSWTTVCRSYAGKTFTTKQNYYYILMIAVKNTYGNGLIAYPMLEVGDKVHDFVPYVPYMPVNKAVYELYARSETTRKEITKIDSFKLSKYYKEQLFLRPCTDIKWFDGLGNYDDFVVQSGTYAGYSSCTSEEYHTKFISFATTYSWAGLSYELLGKDASDTYNIYKYSLKNAFALSDATLGKKRPTILVVGCQHGFEKGAAYVLYNLFRQMVLNWKTSPIMAYLYTNFNWEIIPIANPWGWNNYVEVPTDAQTVGRLNADGVDLNRNYNNDYEDLAPEQKIVYDFVDANKDDALFLFDFHTNGSTRDPNTTSGYSPSNKNWLSIDPTCDCGHTLLDIAFSWETYFTENVVNDYWGQMMRCSFATANSEGYMLKWLGDHFNIPSLTFEGTFYCYNNPAKIGTDGYVYEDHEFAPVVNKYNSIAFINLLLQIVKRFYTKYAE